MQKDRRWTDNKSELPNETNRVVRDALEDLKRLRACNETSKLMIRQSQRLIAEMRGVAVDQDVAQVATAITPRQPALRSNGTALPLKQSASTEELVAEAHALHRRATEAFQSCVRATESFKEMREIAWTLIDEATAALRWDVGWRL